MAMATRRRRRSPSPPATASWPYFPPDLIPEVAKRLTNLQDFFALRAACRTYRALLPLTSSNLASQAPLLLVSVEDGESHALFHPTLHRIHRFRFRCAPFAVNKDGQTLFTDFHSLGCRLALYEREANVGQRRRCSLSIVNLLTGERTFLSSPPNHIDCVLLYGDLVLTWNYFQRAIQYCRLEVADWHVASIIEPYALHCLICVNGVLYALVNPGYMLAIVELSENNNSVELVLLGGNLDVLTGSMPEEYPPEFHLAECGGELILIMEDFDWRFYHVFKWKFGEAKWERITSLAGYTLFLSNDRFVGCLGPDHKGIRGDSIYREVGAFGDWHEYSLDDGSFDEFVAKYPGGAIRGGGGGGGGGYSTGLGPSEHVLTHS